MKLIKPLLQFTTLVCIGIQFSSCVGTGYTDPYIVAESRQKENLYYAPTSPNAPLLTNKYDLSGGGRITTGKEYTSVEMQSAYIAGKHVGVTTSFSVANTTAAKNFEFNRFELGLGYITIINPNLHFESYAGYGTGKTTNTHYTGMSTIKDNYFFLQPAIAVSNNKKTVQFAFVSKFSGNHFNITGDYFDHDREPFSAGQVASLLDQPFHIFWEPGLIFRFGGEHIFFHVGYSYSADLTNSDLYRATDNLSFGVALKFNAGKKNR